VRATPPIGVSNPVNGSMAVPLLISTGNGTARVAVLGVASDGSPVAVDSITETVRQVARRVNIEPMRAIETAADSIPIKPVARDARGAAIADATVTFTAVGTPVNNYNGVNWAGPSGLLVFTCGTITPAVTGVALPENNLSAPQIPVITNPSILTLLPADSVMAGATSITISTAVFDSLGNPAVGRLVRFDAALGTTPNPVQIDGDGLATVTWTPPNTAGRYTLTGVFGASPSIFTLADSTGRIVIRRSVRVFPDVPSPLLSTLVFTTSTGTTTLPNTTGTANLIITIRDQFGNVVSGAKPSDFVLASTPVTGGTFSVPTCAFGVCTATYTAPANAGPNAIADTITITIQGIGILNTPLVLTILP
jgi:hypothetical protein